MKSLLRISEITFVKRILRCVNYGYMNNLVKQFMDYRHKERIRLFLEMSLYAPTQYTINPDGSIDLYGDFTSIIDFKKFPITFNAVYGDFRVTHSKLRSLEGGPKYVSGNYYCNRNPIKSLKGGPIEVGGDFDCRDTKITQLKYAPREVGGDVLCGPNINSTQGLKKVFGQVILFKGDTYITSCEKFKYD